MVTNFKVLCDRQSDSESHYELIVYSEWQEDPESWNNFIKRSCSYLEKIPRFGPGWFGFCGTPLWPQEELLPYWSVQFPWIMQVSPDGVYVAILQDNLLEIINKRGGFSTVSGKTYVVRDYIPQCRRMIWSPNSKFVATCTFDGLIYVHDYAALHLFTIPKTKLARQFGRRFVVGLEFVHSPFKAPGWEFALIVVYSDGLVYCYSVSTRGRYLPRHIARLSSEGISAATFSEKFNMLFISTKPTPVSSTHVNTSISGGVSAWRVISEDPHYLMMFPTEFEKKAAAPKVTLWWWLTTRPSSKMCGVAKMRVSPKSNWLATYHCCGSICVWQIPGLRLQRRWEPQLSRPVDLEWRSDEALIITWDNGTIAILNTVTCEITCSTEEQRVYGRLRVSSPLTSIGFLALECQLVFVPSNQQEEIIENDVAIKHDATYEFVQTVNYLVTEPVEYKHFSEPNRWFKKIFRLIGVVSITPSERYSRYLEVRDYKKALEVAKKFNLDEDKVYQKQWLENRISLLTVDQYLKNVKNESWILEQFTTRVAECLNGALILMDTGLRFTDFDKIFDDGINVDEIDVDSLSEMQKLKLKTRLMILRYCFKLEIYEVVLNTISEDYDQEFFRYLRTKHVAEIAIIYAREGKPLAVDLIVKKYSNLVFPYLLAILNNFAETMDPSEYSYILPQCNSQGEPCKLSQNIMETSKDWVEQTKFRCLLEDEVVSDHFFKTVILTAETVAEWYRVRSIEIERMSGIIMNSVNLLRFGIQFNIQGLEYLLSDLVTYKVLVLELKKKMDFLTFSDFSPLTRALLLLENSTEESFVNDVQKYLIPFLTRCNFGANYNYNNFALMLKVMVKFSETKLKYVFKFIRFILKGNLSLINKRDYLIILFEDCIYSYEKLDLLSETLELANEIILWLRKLSDEPEKRPLLEDMNRAKNKLIALFILQRYRIFESFKTLSEIKYETEEIIRLMSSMTKHVISRKFRSSGLSCIEILLKDILELQEICFTTFPVEMCYKLFASALLEAESLDLIKFSMKFISCREDESSRKNVDYATTVELILKAARGHFINSSSYKDETMLFAKTCLHLIKENHADIIQELNLIDAVRIISDSGVDLLPVQIRNVTDKMKLIECVLQKNSKAYKDVEKMYKLASKLSICVNDYKERYSVVYVRLAVEALKYHNFPLCSRLCSNLMDNICVDGWDICYRLATCSEFQDMSFNLDLLEFAYVYSPPSCLFEINQFRKHLETLRRFEKLASEYNIAYERIDLENASHQSKFHRLKKILTGHLDRKRSSSLLAGSANNEINYLDNGLDLDAEVFEYYLIESYSMDFQKMNDLLTEVDDVIMGYAKSLFDEDLALALSILLCVHDRDQINNFFECLPPTRLNFQISMYFYALLKFINMQKCLPRLSPYNLISMALEEDDEISDMILKYKAKLNYLWQAQTACELNCGINSSRFLMDIEYRRDTIFGLAMSSDLNTVLAALTLAEQNDICTAEIIHDHLKSFLQEPIVPPMENVQQSLENLRIATTIKMKRDIIKEKFLSNFDSVLLSDYSKLSLYFYILNAIDSSTTLCSLTPKAHLKLIKKVKATSTAINYVDLVTRKYDLLEILRPALLPNQYDNVIRLVKNLPDCIRGDFNVSTLYWKVAVEDFYQMLLNHDNDDDDYDDDDDDDDMSNCMSRLKNIQTHWLNKVDASDVKSFLDETIWYRPIALTISYQFRRKIVLSFLSWLNSRNDFRENVTCLIHSIQERLDKINRIWGNVDEKCRTSKAFENCLFDLEEIGNNEQEIIALMKKIAEDGNISQEEFFMIYKSSDLSIGIDTIFKLIARNDTSKIPELLKKQKQVGEMSSSSESVSESFSDISSSLVENRPVTDMETTEPIESVSIETEYATHSTTEAKVFELIDVCTSVGDLKILHALLDIQMEKYPSMDMRSLWVKILYRTLSFRDEKSDFQFVSKLISITKLSKDEIFDLVTSNRSNADILMLVWICIKGNSPEFDDLALNFLNHCDIKVIQDIANKLKFLPCDVVKTIAMSHCYKQLIDIILSDENNASLAKDLIEILEECQLKVEASMLFMVTNNVPATLRSFNTALFLQK